MVVNKTPGLVSVSTLHVCEVTQFTLLVRVPPLNSVRSERQHHNKEGTVNVTTNSLYWTYRLEITTHRKFPQTRNYLHYESNRSPYIKQRFVKKVCYTIFIIKICQFISGYLLQKL
jgi:hypothetical protein